MGGSLEGLDRQSLSAVVHLLGDRDAAVLSASWRPAGEVTVWRERAERRWGQERGAHVTDARGFGIVAKDRLRDVKTAANELKLAHRADGEVDYIAGIAPFLDALRDAAPADVAELMRDASTGSIIHAAAALAYERAGGGPAAEAALLSPLAGRELTVRWWVLGRLEAGYGWRGRDVVSSRSGTLAELLADESVTRLLLRGVRHEVQKLRLVADPLPVRKPALSLW